MRHRVILNFEAQAESIDTDRVLLEILGKAARKGGAMFFPLSGARESSR
jgi:hypothetical protein